MSMPCSQIFHHASTYLSYHARLYPILSRSDWEQGGKILVALPFAPTAIEAEHGIVKSGNGRSQTRTKVSERRPK